MEEKVLKILILDDEARVRAELQEFLENRGFDVAVAGLPSEGLAFLEKQAVDILVLDIKMPEMDGLQVLQKVKPEFPEMEVIMVSGHGDMQTVIEAMRYGATDYFTKPFRLAEVMGAIERTRRYMHLSRKVAELEQGFQLISTELRERVGHNIIGRSKAM
jgi:DNA-binding NtrC family response regulator